ncbi:LRR receptor-like serine threonine-protein kinase (Partial), partial [Seminavis robusta]
TLPSELGQMDSLEWLFVPRNGINGTIPTELGLLHQNLSVLSLLENNLTGTLPSQLGELTSSTAVSVHNNQLTGTLPSEFGQLTSLTMGLTFHNNQLTGTLPTELSSILSLQNLQFQNNRFIGQIPSEFGLLYSLSWLEMANNSLSGIVPQELSALQQSLHTLTLQDNPLLSGSLPDALCQPMELAPAISCFSVKAAMACPLTVPTFCVVVAAALEPMEQTAQSDLHYYGTIHLPLFQMKLSIQCGTKLKLPMLA